ncbi:CAP domain-containing protein [Ensifer adhaerens]|uniref:CAP domain-containing protein n=1 Tax=Ensifer adhaerens TaxID=106592 RepID=UPI001CBD84B4|nr:CAP domain-containing protein [Ensifer adhaerens]MBZ7920343.1 CAP domain-containing protein [Ensifer adhaerens]UAX92829.1 CAP domain-containing protein [Ensifer adhaerens]UAY00464.1 CAP domain-containing protein [Ensifer adhaerens]UAY07847.1 CAP domain-containing protein [Ensifer adhaerens]
MQDRFLLIERRGLLRATAILSLGALAGCTTSKVLTPESGTGSDQTAASLGYVNKLRKGRGLTELVANHAASAAAMSQAARMAKVGKMQHLIGWNDSFYDRMKGQGVTLPAAENIAVGQDDAERAYDAWFKSPKHLENMLGNYRGLGVAVAQNAASGNRPFWAMVLSG